MLCLCSMTNRSVLAVFKQYQDALSKLSTTYETSLERSSTLITAYQPESDIKALIERCRTGPFYPTAQVYESVAHDECDVVFGIDLRKWAELELWTSPSSSPGTDQSPEKEKKKEQIPPVLTAMFAALTELYAKAPNASGEHVSVPVCHHAC